MRRIEREAYLKAIELMRLSVMNPGKAYELSAQILDLMATATPGVLGNAVANRIVVPLTMPTVTHNTVAAAETDWIDFDFRYRGRVHGILTTVLEGHEFRSRIGMQFRVQNERPLFTNGASEAYVPLSVLNRQDSSDDTNALPFHRVVEPRERILQARFKVMMAPLNSGTATYTPFVGLLFEADEET